MDEATIRSEFAKREHSYRLLNDEIIFSIEEALQKHEIAFHLVEGRVKPIDSLITKADQNEVEEPFVEINDICGVRIIALFNSELEACEKVIEDLFEIKGIDKKTTNQPDSQFDYMSDHYIATLPTSFSGTRYDGIKGIKFEIQIRTIATHAWATISHYLDYKSENAIPSNLRKDFYALNALFYIADKHFELFFQASQKSHEMAVQHYEVDNGIQDQEINLDTLSAYLGQRYPNRSKPESGSVSYLLDELIPSGYLTISQLNGDLERSVAAFGEYEKWLSKTPGIGLNQVGAVRISLSIANDEFVKNRKDRDSISTDFQSYQKYLPPSPTGAD